MRLQRGLNLTNNSLRQLPLGFEKEEIRFGFYSIIVFNINMAKLAIKANKLQLAEMFYNLANYMWNTTFGLCQMGDKDK